MKKWFLWGCFVAGFLILLFSWGTRDLHPNELKLTEALQTDFTNITSIEVRYGDGHQLKIADPAIIHQITTKLNDIRLHKITDRQTGAGFLYYMDLGSRNQTLRYSRDVVYKDVTYQAAGPIAEALDELIVRIGREKILDLLPGIRP